MPEDGLDECQYPVVTLTGPRQSGKTTLANSRFPDKPYISLEDPDTRRYATDDPRGFLAQYAQGAILDEIQRAPELASYLQGMVDANPQPGRFILTGSHQFELTTQVSQSMAGDRVSRCLSCHRHPTPHHVHSHSPQNRQFSSVE